MARDLDLLKRKLRENIANNGNAGGNAASTKKSLRNRDEDDKKPVLSQRKNNTAVSNASNRKTEASPLKGAAKSAAAYEQTGSAMRRNANTGGSAATRSNELLVERAKALKEDRARRKAEYDTLAVPNRAMQQEVYKQNAPARTGAVFGEVDTGNVRPTGPYTKDYTVDDAEYMQHLRAYMKQTGRQDMPEPTTSYTEDPEYRGSVREAQDKYNAYETAKRQLDLYDSWTPDEGDVVSMTPEEREATAQRYEQMGDETGIQAYYDVAERYRSGEEIQRAQMYGADDELVNKPTDEQSRWDLSNAAAEAYADVDDAVWREREQRYFTHQDLHWARVGEQLKADGWVYPEAEYNARRNELLGKSNPATVIFGDDLETYWTYDEASTYYGLLNSGREEEAKEYRKYLEIPAAQRRNEQSAQAYADAELGKGARTAIGVARTPFKVINAIDILGQSVASLFGDDYSYLDFKPINYERSNYSGTVADKNTGIVAEELASHGSLNEYVHEKWGWKPNALGWIGDITWGDVYMGGVSLLSSRLNSLMFGGFGGGDWGARLTAAAMGLQAGSDAYVEAREGGATPWRSTIYAGTAGLAEAAWEKFELDGIINKIARVDGTVSFKNVLALGLGQVATGGSQEGMTELTTQAAARVFLNDDSTFEKQRQYYEETLIGWGVDPTTAQSEARRMAGEDAADEFIMSILMGAATGGGGMVMAGGVYNAATQRYQNDAATGRSIRELGNETELAQIMSETAGKPVTIPKSDARLGAQYRRYMQNVGDQIASIRQNESDQAVLDYYDQMRGQPIEGADSREIAINRAYVRAGSADLNKVREALVKSAQGRAVSEKQGRRIQADEAAMGTLAAVDRGEIQIDRAKSDSASKRAEQAAFATRASIKDVQTMQTGREMLRKMLDHTGRTPMGETTEDTRRRAEAVGSTMTVTEDAGSSVGGEEIRKVNGIKAVADGAQEAVVNVTMADGSSRDVKLSDVSFGADVDAEVYEYAAVMATPELANQFRFAARETNMPLDKLANSMNHAYDMGVAGYRNLATVQASSLVKPLNDVRADLVQTAFEMGTRDRGNTVAGRIEQAGKRIAEFSGREWRAGQVTFDGVDRASLSDVQKANVNAVETIAGLFGVNVQIYASKANSEGRYTAEQGSYNAGTNTIRLDINAGRNKATDSMAETAMLRTMSHELTHAIQRNSPKQYEALRDAVLDVLTKQGKDIDNLIYSHMSRDKSLKTKEAAIDEIVADACETMLRDSGAIEQLRELHPDVAKTFAEKVLEFIENIKKAIREIFGTAHSEEAQAIVSELDRIAELWSEAAVATAEVSGRENVGGSTENALKNAEAATENTANPTENSETVGMYDEPARPAEAHIDQRTWAEVGDRKVNAFLNDYKYARIYMPSAASVLAADLQNSTKGERFMTPDGEWNGQKRMTTGIIADALDNGMTWDGLQNAVQTIMNVMNDAGQDGEMRSNAAIKRVELMLDDMLSNGYKDSYGNTFAPYAEYIAYKNSLPGAVAQATPKAAEGSMEFVDVQFQVRDNAEIKPTEADIEVLRKIGRKSINEFTDREIRDTEVWARKFYRELGTKSPYFRRWFGDWRQYSNTKVNLTPVSTISMDEALKSMEYGEFSNGDTEWKIMAGSLGKNDTRSKANGPKISVKMLSDIRGIISNSILLDTEVSLKNSGKKHNDTTFMHKLYAPVMYEGSMYAAKVTVEEYGFGDETGRRFYNLKAIKISPAVGAPIAKTTYGTITRTGDTLTIADFFDVVKRNDPEFKPHPVSKNMLNEDGTPKLMYHGTPYGGYTVFKDWQYFTDDKKYADVYQEPSASSIRGRYNPATNPMTYAAYLSVKKPFDTRDPKMRRIWQDEFYGSYSRTPLSDKGLPDWTDGIDLVEWIEENDYDYDAIILDEGGTGGYGDDVNSRGISVVVRNSTQIKSATDNVGTFDPNNPDIRYSTRATEDDVASMSIKQLDSGYMDAVKSGDEQRMMVYLDEMAYRNGYKSATLMHGTRKFGFTKFAAENGFIFMSDTLRMAQSYAGGRLGERRIHESREDVRERLKKLSPEAFMESYKELTGYELTQSYDDFAKHYEYMVGRKPRKKQGAIYYDKQTLEQYTLDDAVAYLTEYRGGIYELYANLDNFYEVDANFESWKEISGKWIGKRKGTYVKTDDVAEWAKAHGYNGVIIRNVDDMGNLMMPVGDEGQYTDVYIAFDPTLVKSADPVTYDDNGNVIPLSQRFNEDEGDIRYSMRDPDYISDREILANVLADSTQTESERRIVEEYQAKLGKLNQAQTDLNRAREVIREYAYRPSEDLSEADRSTLEQARKDATRYADMLARADKSLLKLQAMEPIKNVLVRAREHIKDRMRDDYDQRVRDARLAERMHEGARTARLQREYEQKLTDQRARKDEQMVRIHERDREARVRLKENYDQRLTDLRERKDQQMIQSREENRAARIRLREDFEQRLTDLRARKDAQIKRLRESQESVALRKTLVRKANSIRKAATNPTDARHIPDNLVKTAGKLMEFFNADDTFDISDRLLQRLTDCRDAYAEIAKDVDAPDKSYNDFVEALFDKSILDDFDELRKSIRERLQPEERTTSRTPKMNAYELRLLSSILDHINFLIRDAGKTFIDGRNIETGKILHDIYTQMYDEETGRAKYNPGQSIMRRIAESDKAALKPLSKAADAADSFNTGMMTPTYFFRMLGGQMQKLGEDLINGETTYALNWQKAKRQLADISSRYNHDKWAYDGATITIKPALGSELKLTREQALCIWATAKRERLSETPTAHLALGGVVLDRDASKPGFSGTMRKDVTGTPLGDAELDQISEFLTDEQKAYADAMVEFCSNPMARLGNETSTKLQGVKIFREGGYYFPFRTPGEFLKTDVDKSNATALYRNEGFTKRLRKGASTPVLITDFSDAIAVHIDKMCRYNALAVPQFNMLRILNYKAEQNASVKALISGYYGTDALGYITQFLKDVHHTDKAKGKLARAADKVAGMDKRRAVSGSLSVAVQQMSALTKAMALVDVKYFRAPVSTKKWFDEAMQYSGTAVIKDMGRFDTGTGFGAADWLLGRTDRFRLKGGTKLEKAGHFIDKASGYFAEMADKITWAQIWQAVKREQAAKTGLDIRSEELKQIAGKRFDEVVRLTQVYDSVMAKSQIMRQPGSSTYTAFMSEQTVTYNMVADAMREGMSGNPKAAIRTIAAVVGTIIYNNLLKGLVTGSRDDEDEEARWIERYLKNVVSGTVNDMVIFNYMPRIRDYWSVALGWDVARPDTSIITRGFNLMTTIGNENKSTEDKLYAAAHMIGAVSPLPVGNIWRDLKAANNSFQAIKGAATGERPFRDGWVWNAARNALAENTPEIARDWLYPDTGDRLYAAVVKGDDEAIERELEHLEEYDGKDEKEARTAFRTEVKEAYLDGEIDDDRAVELVTKYGYSSSKEPEKYVSEWQFEKDYGFSYSKMKDKYLEGKITYEEAVEARQKYGGVTKDKAEDTVDGWTEED